MRTRTVLVTGAGGQVAAAALPLLAARHDVVALAHRAALPGRTIAGDVTRPGLGLPSECRRELAARVDTVVHCAADTGFGPDSAHTVRVNVDGTANVAEFAEEAGARMVHLSSAFVARAEPARRNAEAFGGPEAEPLLTYLRSKQRAELTVEARGVPTVTLLPSLVIGDSRTGRAQRRQGLLTAVFAAIAGWVPWLPGHPHSTLDIVPSDVVARAIAAAVDGEERHGRYWVTSGGAAPTLDRLCEIAHDESRRHAPALPRVRLVPPPDAVHLLASGRFSGFRAMRLRQMLGQAVVLHGTEPFPSDHHLLLGGRPTTPADAEDAFRRTFGHLLREYLRSRPAGPRAGAAQAVARMNG